MPELPEVETVRAGIADHSLGRPVRAVRVVDARSLRRYLPGPTHFEAALTGRALRGAYRRGKYLWLTLSEADGTLADEALVVHLGMSGQLLVRDKPDGVSGSDSEARAAFDEQPRHLRVALELGPAGATSTAGATGSMVSANRASTGQRLLFVDQRIFGGMFLSLLVPDVPAAVAANKAAAGEVAPGEVPERFLVPEAVKHIARDPLDEFFDPAAVRRKFLRTSSGIKKVLLDQSVISGVGNIFRAESLYRQAIDPLRPCKSLSDEELERLWEDNKHLLVIGVRVGRIITTETEDRPGVPETEAWPDHANYVYMHHGEPCRRCGTTIRMEEIAGRKLYWCPGCQV